MSKTTGRSRNTYHVGNLAPQLIQVAREMLEEVGPAKLSIRAISEKIGVSATATYHHFANRVDLLSHLAAQGFNELEKVLLNREANIDKFALLRNSSLAYFKFARKNPALYQLMFGPELSNAERNEISELQHARDTAFHELKKIIAEVLEKDVDSPEVKQGALASWSYTHGLTSLVIHHVFDYPEDLTDERFVDRTLQGFSYLFQSKE
ncbi:TetR/AcrR family transcriptional regulator [Acinetobacter sichuanensis]|uniref:TetR/AcrR family transcriptional regulator n=1 Tax=Acinetobacter sichuanensis TaxID=2136183 RepID=A0A371YR30_9GAMM|nr:TetR/AcrR family transcriptional regulator [Acinetobacter sichuanensis]RFC83913.1 TetR/AcrR family transcriptional regulator [Acinetobacter sichuanensis]